MPWKVLKRPCKQSDGKSGKYVIVKIKRDGGTEQSSCHTSEKKAQGGVRARHANEGKMRITKKQLRRIIREELNAAALPAADFPPVSHPVIAPYFNEEKYHDKEGTGWAKEYKTYRYKHGGGTSGHQDLVIYYLKTGNYMARVYGAYNNRLSDDDKGEHPDAISAVQKALNTVPGGRPPLAKDLIVKVGEKSRGDTGGVPMYD